MKYDKKPRQVSQRSTLVTKPFLENTEEAEQLLTRLRKELTNALACDQRFQIK
jgi:hypothetical protein